MSSVTHKGLLDAVEDKYLDHHDDRGDAVEVEQVEGLEPSLTKNVTDY
jgi:hypothetical protein